MVITILTREDVVVTDPDRFMAAARRAYQRQHPDVGAREVEAAVSDVYDAVHQMIDTYGSVASDHPDVAAGATPRPTMHGGSGLLPGDRVHDRPDGLSPSGRITEIVLGEQTTVQDYGCFLPETVELFAGPARRSQRS